MLQRIYMMSAFLTRRLDQYTHTKELHFKNERVLKALYYSLGLISTALSCVLTVFASNDKSMMILYLSFGVLFVNSVLNFGKMEEKIAQHKDMRNQYQTLIIDIEEYLDNTEAGANNEQFETLIDEKHKLLLGYEANTFCFQ